MGTQLPLPQRGTAPKFLAHICCDQMAAWIKMSLGMKLGLGQGDVVLDGDHAPPPHKGAEPPKFSAYVYCGQMAGWMKLVLGMQVGFNPGDFVLDGDPAPPSPKGGPSTPNFRRLCVRWRPSLPYPTKGAEPPSQFLAHFYAAEIGLPVWGTPSNFNSLRVLAALLHSSKVVSFSQTLWR